MQHRLFPSPFFPPPFFSTIFIVYSSLSFIVCFHIVLFFVQTRRKFCTFALLAWFLNSTSDLYFFCLSWEFLREYESGSGLKTTKHMQNIFLKQIAFSRNRIFEWMNENESYQRERKQNNSNKVMGGLELSATYPKHLSFILSTNKHTHTKY